ncbi:transposase, partial [Streptomyces zhihengii]
MSVAVGCTGQRGCCARPLSWQLLPSAWDEPEAEARRRACRIPETEHHRPKWQMALDMLDDLAVTGSAARSPRRGHRLRRERRLPPRSGRTRPCLGAPGQG